MFLSRNSSVQQAGRNSCGETIKKYRQPDSNRCSRSEKAMSWTGLDDGGSFCYHQIIPLFQSFVEGKMPKLKVPQKFIQEVYERERERHPDPDLCYGEWTWIEGTLKVKCQSCGYTMKINPKTKKLEHLDSPTEATKDCLIIQEYGQHDYEG